MLLDPAEMFSTGPQVEHEADSQENSKANDGACISQASKDMQ